MARGTDRAQLTAAHWAPGHSDLPFAPQQPRAEDKASFSGREIVLLHVALGHSIGKILKEVKQEILPGFIYPPGLDMAASMFQLSQASSIPLSQCGCDAPVSPIQPPLDLESQCPASAFGISHGTGRDGSGCS